MQKACIIWHKFDISFRKFQIRICCLVLQILYIESMLKNSKMIIIFQYVSFFAVKFWKKYLFLINSINLHLKILFFANNKTNDGLRNWPLQW